MNIKGSLYTFKELSKAHNADEFQKQIDIIQENLENCKRKIDNFDVYRITRAIADLNDIDAVKAKLLPGEAAVIRAPSQGKWHTGQLILRLNNLEYVEIEPFQTGTYYPSSLKKIGESANYILTYSFSANLPLKGSKQLNEEKLSSPYEEISTNLTFPEEKYYYSLSNTEEGIFMMPLKSDSSIAFKKKETRPILKFFVKSNEGLSFEEVGFSDYKLKEEGGNYTLSLEKQEGDADSSPLVPENLYVAIK